MLESVCHHLKMSAKTWLCLCLLYVALPVAAQQPVTVSGTVFAEGDVPLAGVSVQIQGAPSGTATDAAGRFTIQARPNSVLVFSYIGYEQVEHVLADASQPVIIKLTPGGGAMGEVVVTALGIRKESRALTYAMQQVSGEELTKVPQTNLMNSLSGKVAGMTIGRSGALLGGSVKVRLRGNKSAAGNNQPLYVIDGVPLMNFARESVNGSFSTADAGDGIANLNPDDIASMSVLKGASAASLYGSQAANGVILITTKKGRAGVSKVDFNSNFTSDAVSFTPEFQNSYGETAPGSAESWGAPVTNAKDITSGFFRKGQTWINSIGFSSGTDKMQTYLSYANTNGKGIVENNSMNKHNFNIRQTSRFFDNKLQMDANVNIISQELNNNPVAGFQSGPLYGLYTFPRGKDFEPYREYEMMNSVRNLKVQNWPFISADNQNPYWVMHRNLYENKRNRTIFNLSAKYNITPWINLQLRGNMDKTNDLSTAKFYVGTAQVYGGTNGGFNISDIENTQFYGDALLNFSKTFGKFGINAVAGSSITDSRTSGESASSTNLYIANVFTIQNMIRDESGYGSASEQHQQLQAVFGNINLSFNEWLFLDVTGRNDWSSNLSYTPNGSYFYPSVGITTLLNEALRLPDFLSMAKIRASYAVVGNTVPIYVTNPLNYLAGNGNISFNNTAPFTDLKPEKTRSLELGTELRFMENRFSLDLTYYKTNSINQFFSVAVPPGTGYSRRFINGGDIQNSGVEIVVGYNTLPARDFGWNSSVNFSSNKNLIKKLATDIDQFVLTDDINNYSSILKVGGSYGDIYGQVLDRNEKGQVIINADGYPVVKAGPRSLLGNSNPDYRIGWNNNLTYKNFGLSFLIDGSFGGEVMSLTEQVLDGVGVSKRSGEARDNGGVAVNGMLKDENTPVTLVDPQKWYKTIGGRQHVTGEYMYDATTVRLRELSLGYTLPAKIFGNGFVKSLRLALTGRNLVYFYRKAPFDPDITFSVGNGFSGIDVFGLPATRSLGFNLNVSF